MRISVAVEEDPPGIARLVVASRVPIPREVWDGGYFHLQFTSVTSPTGLVVPILQMSVWHYDGDAGEERSWSTDVQALDVSDGSGVRRLLEHLVGQASFEVVVSGQGLTRIVDGTTEGRGTNELRELLANLPSSLPAEVWREAVRGFHAGMRGMTPGESGADRAAPTPAESGPFRARVAGDPPATGSAWLHGIELPAGSRWPADELDDSILPFWVSDEPVDDPLELAGRFAAVFAETGLWPLLWSYDDEVASYLDASPDLSRIDEVDLVAEMAAVWAAAARPEEAIAPFDGAFPGLAPAMPAIGDDEPFDPFSSAAESLSIERARLLLVPCVRPADAVGALALEHQRMTSLVHARLLRSYEDRFGAIPVALDPSQVTFAVERPPTGKSQALRLAAELFVYAPQEDDGRPDALRDNAQALRASEPAVWVLGGR